MTGMTEHPSRSYGLAVVPCQPPQLFVVVERVIGPPNEMPEGKFSDLNMMVQYAAMERTDQEFDNILKNGGFKMTEIIRTRSPHSIIVAQPISTGE